jgi:[acyl-carrier-protein] S-malonyltransferase
MQSAVAAGEGAMAALLGLDDEQVIALCSQVTEQMGQSVEAANFNTKGQVVVAGATAAVQEAMNQAKSLGGKAIILPVSVPSHCSLMKPAADQLAETLKQTTLSLPKYPVVHNVSAAVATDVAGLQDALVQQLYRPVRWTQTMQALQDAGVAYIVECGAGNVLANLAKRLPDIKAVYPTDSKSRLEDALSAISLAEGKLA